MTLGALLVIALNQFAPTCPAFPLNPEGYPEDNAEEQACIEAEDPEMLSSALITLNGGSILMTLESVADNSQKLRYT